MTTIGTAVLQIIPSLDGVSKSIDKQLGGTLRASGKQGGKQFAKGVGDGLKDLEREVDSAAKAYGRLKDKASDALGKVRTDEAALQRLRNTGASDDRIIRAEERLATSRRNSSRANREAEDSHKSLLTAQKALGDGTDNLGSKFGSMSNLAGVAGKAITGAAVVAAGAAVVGVAALAAGVLAAGNALYDLGAQFDDTFDNIRIKTGATGPALQQLEDATKRLATNVPLSIGEIGNVVAETSRALHLTGPDLDRVAGSIANLGRLTGENVDVRTLGKAFRGFGVNAKDQVPALDALFRASQSTGVGVNELLATVVKGGAGLRQFGFDFGQSAALATQFEESGLDADKAMTGLTKGLAGLAKDGKTGQDALKGTVGEIKNLLATGQDAAALDLTNKLFGAKGGVQFFEAIKNGSLDLDTLADSISNTGDTIDQAAKDTDDWAERWQTFKNTAEVALQPLATGLFDSINTELTKFADWVTAHQPEIIDFFTLVGTAAVRGLQNVARGVGGMLQAIGDIAGGIGNIQGTVLKFEAWQARVRGDTETADELHRQSEEAYGWGESIRAMGDKLANLNLDSWAGQVRNWGAAAKEAAQNAQGANGAVTGLATALGALPLKKVVTVDADTGPAEVKMQSWFDKWKSIIAAPPTPTPAPPIIPSLTDPTRPPLGGGRASGGPIFGAGGPKSDIIPIWASHGEHMLPADEVGMMGGQAGVYQFRSMLRAGAFGGGGEINWLPGEQKKGEPLSPGNFNPNVKLDTSLIKMLGEPGVYGMLERTLPDAIPSLAMDPAKYLEGFKRGDVSFAQWATMVMGQNRGWMQHLDVKPKPPVWPPALGFAGGGAIGPDVQAAGALVGTPYSQANRTDCSGMVARVIDRTLGLPEAGLMSTKNAAEWLAAHGFKKGIGGPGTISVGWYDHGPNPNDGHMAMTLSDGSNAEAGGSSGPFTIGSATGASDPQFDQHMFLPTVYGEGPAGAGTASPFAGGSAVAAMTGAGTATPTSVSGGGTSSSSSGGGSSFSLPSSIGDLAGFGLANLGKGVGTTKSGSDLSLFGEAAGAAVSGQVDSALGVLGVSGSPGWLQAISTLVGGISIGGGGGSAAPLSATSTGMGTPPPDDPGNMHGTRAGQQPGPGVTYNITARDTEDAFIKAQRIEREKAAAKLSRF